MLKIRIRTLTPIRRDPKKRNYLKPGEYIASINKSGMFRINTKHGDYIPLPGQFEFLNAPDELLEYWRATFNLLEAQENYKTDFCFRTALVLSSAQGKYDVAKQRFEKLFIKKEIK